MQEQKPEERALAKVGKRDAKKHLGQEIQSLVASNVAQAMGQSLNQIIF